MNRGMLRGDPLEQPDFLRALRTVFDGVTLRRVLWFALLPIVALGYEYRLDRETRTVTATVVSVGEPLPPRGRAIPVQVRVGRPDGRAEEATVTCGPADLAALAVGPGGKLPLLFNPGFAGEAYRVDRPGQRWVLTLVGAVLFGSLVLLALGIALAKRVLKSMRGAPVS